MTLILDSSGLLSAVNTDQRLHQAAKEALERAAGPLVLSPFVLAELDYMILTRYGPDEELASLDEVARGVYRLAPFSTEDIAETQAIIERYTGFGNVGLADASNVVPAERYGTRDILTLDERHFRAIHGPQGRPLRLLPADL
ncbi:MAG: PIN domain-containing protein [Actinomycetota bacterium]|nr:PIN domain-containing protein [Actinomycetota bacterium]